MQIKTNYILCFDILVVISIMYIVINILNINNGIRIL